MKKRHEMPVLMRLDAICASDFYRPVLQCIYIDGHWGVATDAHLLIRTDISSCFYDFEKMNGKMINRTVWFRMLHCNYRKATETGIICKYMGYEVEFKYSNEGTYPDYSKVLSPAFTKAIKKPGIAQLNLNPGILSRLQKLGGMKITFTFCGNELNFIQAENYHGLLMSMMGENDLKELEPLFKTELQPV